MEFKFSIVCLLVLLASWGLRRRVRVSNSNGVLELNEKTVAWNIFLDLGNVGMLINCNCTRSVVKCTELLLFLQIKNCTIYFALFYIFSSFKLYPYPGSWQGLQFGFEIP